MRLTDVFIDLIVYVAGFLKTVGARQPSFERVTADIHRLAAESRDLFDSGSFSRREYNMGRFAVFAWIDEAITDSQWREKHRWRGETLQQEYFGATDAGARFFERLDLVEPNRGGAREVYYLCLAMGFTGRYRRKGDEEFLQRLKASNLKRLVGDPGGLASLENEALFPEAYQADSQNDSAPGNGMRFSASTMLLIGFPFLVFVALFLIFSGVLNSYGEKVVTQLIREFI